MRGLRGVQGIYCDARRSGGGSRADAAVITVIGDLRSGAAPDSEVANDSRRGFGRGGGDVAPGIGASWLTIHVWCKTDAGIGAKSSE